MGVFIAAVIILALVIYAIKDLLSDKDFASWVNIALTTLILFTVILSIFMILHKKQDPDAEPDLKKIKKPAAEAQAQTQTEAAAPANTEMSDSEIMLAIAEEYVKAEDDFKAKNPSKTSGASKAASDLVINKYGFTTEEWNSFLEDAAKNDLFTKARANLEAKKANGDVNYVVAN